MTNFSVLQPLDFKYKALGIGASLILSCLLSMLLVRPCESADDLVSVNSLDINSIVEKALQAYGDKERLSAFGNDCQYIGTISSQSDNWQSHEFKYTRKAPSWRKDMDHGTAGESDKSESTIFDGTIYWQLVNAFSVNGQKSANNRTEEKMPPIAPSIKNDTNTACRIVTGDQACWLGDEADREPFILANWQNPSYQFKLIGRSNYKQIPAYAIEIKDDKNRVTMVYIDCSNYLVLAMTFQSYPMINSGTEPKKVNITKEYAENRPALGSIWPFKETLLINKEPVSIFEFSTITSADDIASDYLKPPSPKPQPSRYANYARLTEPVIVPFEYCQREIICRGKIENMGPLWFLIDTGTSDTIIDRSFAAQCLLNRGGNFQISSFRGNIQSQNTQIESLELGSLIVNDIPAQIADLSSQSKQVGRSIAGIIGMNILGNYLTTIDYAKPCLTFADTISGARPEDTCNVPFAQISGTSVLTNGPPAPRIKATLPGGDATILLMDTGAAFNHLSSAIAYKHLSENIDKTAHTIEATGLDGCPVRLGLITLDPVIVGSYKVHKVRFTYPIDQSSSSGGSKPLPRVLGSDILSKDLDIAGILGNPFFEHFLVTIDCSFHRLMLKPNPQFEVSYELEQSLSAGDLALYTKRDFRQAEFAYQKALVLSDSAHDLRYQALAQGRMGNLRRMMSHDLKRPEHAQMSYQYFKKANELATQGNFKDVQGRILADWSLLYSENGQLPEAQKTMQKAIMLAPKDAVVNVDYAVHMFRDRLYSEAQKYIEKALFYDPANWQALWYQVKLSEMFQDFAKEKATLKEIVERYPSSKVAESKLKSLEAASASSTAN